MCVCVCVCAAHAAHVHVDGLTRKLERTQLVSSQQLSAFICLARRHNNKSSLQKREMKCKRDSKRVSATETWRGVSCIGHMSTHGVCVMSSRLNSKLRLFYASKKQHYSRHKARDGDKERDKDRDRDKGESQSQCQVNCGRSLQVNC